MNHAEDLLSSEMAGLFLEKQLKQWPLAAANYQALRSVETRMLKPEGHRVCLQYNPTRILSTSAKTDKKVIRERPCFLCPDNLPEEQIRFRFRYEEEYLLLCNPYPIFLEHFTIPSTTHQPQAIANRFSDFLQINKALDKYTLFYNGPQSGASAPDHIHFQAVTRNVMPLDKEIETIHPQREQLLINSPEGSLHALKHYMRNGFIIRAASQEKAIDLFQVVYESAGGGKEPDMNLFSYYTNGKWTIVVILRKTHRPWQYNAEGKDHILSSPGAADMGGLFITPRKEDFEKITPEILTDIYKQVGYDNEQIEAISQKIHIKQACNQK
ncbi:DUF4922 domain-containing protein [Parabacteroides sp. OttesenSCG-928-G06]|nr:DUF4922 domain-containing protein [Parabacteroides sp. OttesenSCG-928-K15]MDL2282505.1 DUF4922 domain-containing protein [Parabacteroides sp. OttesenSCG-928-G06]